MTIFMTLLAITAGISFAVQGPINTALGKRTDVLQASLISFFGGTVICLLIVLAAGDRSLGLSHITEAQPWELIGGFFGAVNVCVTIIAMPILGVALTLAAIMLGQLFMGTLIDQFGMFGADAVPVSPLRIAGIALVACGILFIYYSSREKERRSASGHTGNSDGHPAPLPESHSPSAGAGSVLLIAVSFLAGILGAMQSPINASLAGVVGSWEGSFISFLAGFLGIFLVMLIKTKGHFPPLRGKGTKAWMYSGGAFGVVGIFLSLYTVLPLGAALQVAGGMAGQLLAAVVIDTFGLIQSDKVVVTKGRITGISIIVLGVILVTLAEL